MDSIKSESICQASLFQVKGMYVNVKQFILLYSNLLLHLKVLILNLTKHALKLKRGKILFAIIIKKRFQNWINV